MSSDILLSAKNLGKCYHIYKKPQDRLKQSFMWGRKQYYKEFWAIEGIDLEIRRGESFGIIGRNGAGKTTLLQLITGILKPTTGEIEVNGRVAALLGLGAGFNKELSGEENIHINASVLGLSKAEVDERFDEIVDFADIGDFLYQPVKTYSSGMYVRLAFAVAINVEPDILIIDEALSVGDKFFSAKCATKIRELTDKGVTLLFTSHNTGAVKSLCKNAILLEKGRLISIGTPDDVVATYNTLRIEDQQQVFKSDTQALGEADDSFSDRDKGDGKALAGEGNIVETDNRSFKNDESFRKRASFHRIQNGKAEYTNIEFLDEKGRLIDDVEYGQQVTLRMYFKVNEDLNLLAFAYHLRDKNAQNIVYSDSLIEGKSLKKVKSGEEYIIDWKFAMALKEGVYNVAAILSVPIDVKLGIVEFCDFVHVGYQFNVNMRQNGRLSGFVHWENEIEVRKV